MLPKIIHQIWLDKKGREGLPSEYPLYEEYSNTWKQHNGDFEYTLWTNALIEKLWELPELAKWKGFYEKLSKIIEKCDFSRCAILYVKGGLYVDLDFKCQKNISPLIKNRDVLVAYEPEEHFHKGRLTSNSILGCAKNHPFFADFMDYIVDNYHYDPNVVHTTGPFALLRYMTKNDYLNSDYLVDTCSVIPYSKDGLSKECTSSDDSYCYTYWNEGTNWHLGNGGEYIQQFWPYWLILLILLIVAIYLSLWLNRGKFWYLP